ncbi:MAG TPA: alpha/beta hydrolase [Mycobacteriales bacterium]|nr:alpha/beta hydrolase [Mycobacteriales bacterium]
MTDAIVRADVVVEVAAGEHVAATVFAPSDVGNGAPRIVVFAFPGGGLGRGYFDVSWAGDESYSQARHHVRRGWIVVACDHLGVGDSSLPDPASLTYERLASANDVAVRQILDGLRDGSLVDGVGQVPVRATIGLGHSMGGCVSIVQQGNHATFDALAVLGFSAIQTTIPVPTGKLETVHKERDDASGSLEQDIDAAGGVGMFRWAFYADDVLAALVDADMGSGYPRTGSPPAWGSPTTPPVAFSMLSPGVVEAEAAVISSPVFIASGDRDVIPELRAEASAYSNSSDITLVETAGMAHMHNMAGSRQLLWNRLHQWAESIFA